MRVLFGFTNDFPGFTVPKKRKAIPAPSKTRRPKGSGSSSPDARRGGWKGKVPVGKTAAGATLYRYFHANSQRAVEDLMRGATRPDPDTVTVGEWCDRWLAACKKKPGTKLAYATRVEKRIRPSLGAINLAALTSWDIEVAAGAWAGGPSTIRSTLGTLSTLLRAARRAKLIRENPVSDVRAPAPAEQRFDLFTRAELKAIQTAGRAKAEWGIGAVLVLTGCRIGEAIALSPADYDAAKGTLSIARTRTNGEDGTPKSRHSARVIEVPPELGPTLAAGGASARHYNTAVGRWEKLLAHLGLRYRAPHQVRHSVASYALADGVPPPDLAAHLGHTLGELLKTYGHPTGAPVGSAIGRVAGL